MNSSSTSRWSGRSLAPPEEKSSPKYLLVELEFMHYLTFLEAGAGDGHEGLRRGQQDFLSRHLARWLPALRTALAEDPEAMPYSVVMDAVVRFVGADATYIGSPMAGPQPPTGPD